MLAIHPFSVPNDEEKYARGLVVASNLLRDMCLKNVVGVFEWQNATGTWTRDYWLNDKSILRNMKHLGDYLTAVNYSTS